jgi:hypothetical protein
LLFGETVGRPWSRWTKFEGEHFSYHAAAFCWGMTFLKKAKPQASSSPARDRTAAWRRDNAWPRDLGDTIGKHLRSPDVIEAPAKVIACRNRNPAKQAGFLFSLSSVCSDLPLRRFSRAMLGVLENGHCAGSKGRSRDERGGETNNRDELLHDPSPKFALICPRPLPLTCAKSGAAQGQNDHS